MVQQGNMDQVEQDEMRAYLQIELVEMDPALT